MAILSGAICCAASAAGGAYLARIGPSPLMFFSAPPRRDPAEVLPPLKMSNAAVATNSADAVSFESPEDFDAQSSTETPAPAPPEAQLGPPPPDAIIDLSTNHPAPANQITPQSFLKYFTIGTNRDVVVPAPVEFTPPPPGGGRASSATYISR